MQSAVRKTLDGAEKISEKITGFIGSKLFIGITFAYFIFQAAYMALVTPLYLPADERYHSSYIKLYAESGYSPFISENKSYNLLGVIDRNPFFFYHYLMSFPYRISHLFTDSIMPLRFMNIGLAICTIIVLYKIAKSIGLNDLATNIGVFIFANILMVPFLSASINYDNLFLLITMLSILYLLKIWEKTSVNNMFILATLVMAGLITKSSYLAIAVPVVAIAIISFVKHFKAYFADVKEVFPKPKTIAIVALFILVLIPFLNIYVGNVVKYGSYQPNCVKIRPVEECRESHIFSRDERAYKNQPAALISAKSFVISWYDIMVRRSLGEFGHRSFEASEKLISFFKLFTLVLVVATVRKISLKDKKVLILIPIIVFYLAALIHENHSAYVGTGIMGFGTQGRYAFAVLPIALLIGIYYLYQMMSNKILSAAVSILLILVFGLGGIYTFMKGSDSEWWKADMPAPAAMHKPTMSHSVTAHLHT